MSLYTAAKIAEFAARPLIKRSIAKACRIETGDGVEVSGITQRLATHVIESELRAAGWSDIRVKCDALSGEGKYTVTARNLNKGN